MKPQTIRLADVFLIGPLMIWGGWKLQRGNPLLGQTLLLSGVGTVVYNGYNYLQVQRYGALPGGRADGMAPGAFDPQQLREGVAVEMEHTHDPELAREIAMDHLTEDARYYTKLKAAGL